MKKKETINNPTYLKKIVSFFKPQKYGRYVPLFYAVFLLGVLDLLLLVGVGVFFILIQFINLRQINLNSQNFVTFSYFQKRPDLLSSSKALVIYDATSRVVLLSKNDNLRFSPASTTKIMTALVALDHYDPATVLTANSLENNPDSSKMGLFVGEKMSVLNLIYGMLLPSGGDAAEVLAENYPGGKDAFVNAMNEKAKEMGLLNSYFTDPAGYNDTNYTTAYDLAQIGAAALKNKTLANIVSTKKIVVFNDDGTIPHTLVNLNELLGIPGVTGIKTGFTNEAEGVLATSFLHEGQEYVIIVLRSKDRFQDTLELINGVLSDLKKESFRL